MKAYFWIPFAVLAGVLVGAWGPRAEIRALKEQANEQKTRPRNVAAEGFKAFAGFANIPDEARRPRHRRQAKPLFAASSNRVERTRSAGPKPDVATNTPATVAAESHSSTNAPSRKPMSPEDLRARIEEAQELWRTRVEVARTSWKSKLKLTGDNAGKFDAALDEMNEKLYDTMQTMAQLVAEKDKVTPELGLRLVGDATTVMAETYEKVGTFVPTEMRDRVSEMPMTDFIDPGVAEPLISVQDKIEGSFPGAPHR